jgi:hypothetical protein
MIEMINNSKDTPKHLPCPSSLKSFAYALPPNSRVRMGCNDKVDEVPRFK